MLRIEEIELDNFKGQRGTHRLGRLNLVTGENGAGKSAITLAAMFAATGNTPDGKKLDTVLEYAGPRGCGVRMKFEGGGGFKRSLHVDNRDAKLSQTIDLAGRRDQLGLKAAEAAVEAMIGRLPEMWNVNEFLALSAEAKRRYLLRLFAASSTDGLADPNALLARIVVEYLRRCPDGGESVADSLTAGLAQATVADQLNNALACARETLADEAEFKALATIIETLRLSIDGDIAQAVSAMVEVATSATNNAKVDHDAARKALEEISAHKATLTVVATQAATLREEDARLAAELAEVIQAIGNAEGRANAEATIRSRIDVAQKAAAAKRNQLRELTEFPPTGTKANADALVARAAKIDRGARVRELEAEADRLKGTLTLAAENPASPEALEAEADKLEASLPQIDDGPRQAAQTKAEQCISDAAKWSRKQTEANGAAVAARTNRDALLQQVKRAKESPWAEAQGLLKTAIAHLGESNDTEFLEPLRVFIVKQVGADDVAALEQKVVEATDLIASKERERDDARLEHKRCLDGQLQAEQEARQLRDAQSAARSDRQAQLQRIGDLRIKAESARRQAGNVVNARAEAEGRIREIERQVATLATEGVEFIDGGQRADTAAGNLRKEAEQIHAKLIEHADAVEETTNNIQAADDIAERAKAELDSLAPAGDLDGLRAKRSAIESTRSELASQIKARADFEAAERCYSDTEAKVRAKCTEWEVCKLTLKAVQVVRDTMMTRLSRPVTDRMNRFLGYCCVRGETAYCDIESSIGREVCEFGLVRGDRKISIRAMSGGERTIFAAALQYALITLSAPPLQLLLIEADQCDGGNLLRLTTACEAVADELSNIIVTTHGASGIAAMSGWTVIPCGNSEAEAIAEAVRDDVEPLAPASAPNLRLVSETAGA